MSRLPCKEDEAPASGPRPQNSSPPSSSSEGSLWVAQERLWKNEHQSTEQAIALVERDQRISALRAECDWLTSQLQQERQRRQAIEPELDAARSEWAACEKRAHDFENSFTHASARLQRAEISIGELSHQLELVKTERSEAILNLAQQHETLAELNLQLEKARAERVEMEQILGRARSKLDRAGADLAAAESAAEQSAAESSQIKATLAHLRAELGLAVSERDKLQALVKEDHQLSEFADLKSDRDRFETELKEVQGRQGDLREKIDALCIERDTIKRERTELQLMIAAMRDAHDDSQLQQDNEVLRRMVERLNEELKLAQPEIAAKRKRAASGGVVREIARAAISRCFVPDPDVAEGR